MSPNDALINICGSLPWAVRFYFDAEAACSDVKWIIVFGLWANRAPLRELVIQQTALVDSSLFLVLAVALLGFLVLYFYQSESQDGSLTEDAPVSPSGFLQPLIFPSRTTHQRFSPKRHSFSYSYLLVGIPIGFRGAIKSFLSVDEKRVLQWWPRTWFSVHAGDYLNRGDDDRGLKGKLQSFLMYQVRMRAQAPRNVLRA